MMHKPLKMQHNPAPRHMIENHAPRLSVVDQARARGLTLDPTPPCLPGPRARRATPPGGIAPQVCLPLSVTPCRVSGLTRFQKKSRTGGTQNGVGGCVSPALVKIGGMGVRV